MGVITMNKHYYIKDVVTLELNKEKCTGCGMCTIVCPHAVFAISEAKASVLDRDACMECGACVQNCPVGALSVKAGVGCAAAVIKGRLSGTPPTCGESCESTSTCC